MTPGLLIASYLFGTIPTAQVVGRRAGHDPTAEGSGNPGATNVYRLAGVWAGTIVLVVDLAKGAVPALVGLAVGGRGLGAACGAAAVLGHVAPLHRKLRGGKGVATAGGMSLVLWPLVSVVLLGGFVLLAALLRTASVGSLFMAAGLPAGVAASGRPATEVAIAAGVAIVVVLRHHGNIRRLLRGEELSAYSPATPEPQSRAAGDDREVERATDDQGA